MPQICVVSIVAEMQLFHYIYIHISENLRFRIKKNDASNNQFNSKRLHPAMGA